MKQINKKDKQVAAKKAHLQSIQAAKARRRQEPNLARAEPTREEKPRLLIVCGGENTEPDYFNHFRLVTATVKILGFGFTPKVLVEKAIVLMTDAQNAQKPYDEVWCVFDRDDFPDFMEALRLAAQSNMRVAWSNQAFEYWLILHFEDHQGGAMHRNSYDAKLNGYLNPLGVGYDGRGSKRVSRNLFDLLQAFDLTVRVGADQPPSTRQQLAIRRAEQILRHHNLDDLASAESATTVYQLVEVIQQHI